MAIVKSAPAAAIKGVLMRRDAAAPARPLKADAPNPRLVILFKSLLGVSLGVSPPCLIAYSSSVMVPTQAWDVTAYPSVSAPAAWRGSHPCHKACRVVPAGMGESRKEIEHGQSLYPFQEA